MFKKLYELIMAFLAILALILMVIELSCSISFQTSIIFDYIDKVVLIIFAVDYFTRLFRSQNKWLFIKENLFDLIAILPFNAVFRIARLTRLLRLTKIFKVIKFSAYALRLTKKLARFLKTNNFYYILIATLVLVLSGAILISVFENMKLSDALWWSFVTTTTVGYGDISPKTGIGRIIAIILMMTGIGFIGMLTGTISTYFIKSMNTKTSYKVELIENIKTKLDNFEELTLSDIDEMRNVLLALKSCEKDNIDNKTSNINSINIQACPNYIETHSNNVVRR